MNLFLIKIGKAWQTIRREGLWRGGKRVASSFVALFGRVGSGNILFITGGVGDSARYRAHHVAEELKLQGFTTGITVQDNPLLSSYADKFSVFIFHRVLFTPSVAKLIAKCKAKGKEIIFETDDLVYDPEYLQYMDYFKKMNGFEKKLYEHGVGGEILADEYVTVCTTTTTYLADKLLERGKRVIIVPNKLSVADVGVASEIVSGEDFRHRAVPDAVSGSDAGYGAQGVQSTQEIRIGYFSGTMSHNKDFATITDALVIIMRQYANVKLYLVGPLETEHALQGFSERIVSLPYVPRDQHFANIASVDINVAPLEIGNPFCESKSELKFFEAGIVKVPTVAAATVPYREAIMHGVDGFVASTTEEWVSALRQLVEDATLRERIGAQAFKTAKTRYANDTAENDTYYNYLRSKLV